MQSTDTSVVFSETAQALIRMRNESYHFISEVPKKIGDKAVIFVKGIGPKVVRLQGAKGAFYCKTWLVEA